MISPEAVLTNNRNEHGVKFSCDMYRLIDGQPYTHWASWIPEGLLAAYLKGGVKYRVVGGGELLIRKADQDAARAVDERLGVKW